MANKRPLLIRGKAPDDRIKPVFEYDIPSREQILQQLARGLPMTFDEVAARLKVSAAAEEGLARRLRAMERDAQVVKNRRDAYLLAAKLNAAAGVVEGHSSGGGSVVLDGGGDVLALSVEQMAQVMHRDRVVVRPTGGYDRRGRPEAVVIEVLERPLRTVVGRLKKVKGLAFVTPFDRRVGRDIPIEPTSLKRAISGSIVTAVLSRDDDPRQLSGALEKVLGRDDDARIEIEIALAEFDLPHQFDAATREQARRTPAAVRRQDRAGRIDMRELPFVTIDGETARDFDDAVLAVRERGGYRLWVAIADVSHYVAPNSALDAAARERATSVYFPRRVIPMLPEKLSNGICSLNPQLERLAVVCEVAVSRAGKLGSAQFHLATICSAARLTYTRVAAYLGDANTGADLSAGIRENLDALNGVYRALAKARGKRGALEFESTETVFQFDAAEQIAGIAQVKRNDAHRLIEECMLAANVCASDYLQRAKHPTLYRVHQGPSPSKLNELRAFLGRFGVQLGGGTQPGAADYAKVLDSIKARPDSVLLSTVMLRSLRQAHYSPENVGHFGLAYDSYVHFTSPIRRYPDLLVHRAIKAVAQHRRYAEQDWNALGAHCSARERVADEASRAVDAWLKCRFMSDKIGDRFDASISAVTSFGIFVALRDFYVEGLVHISELGRDYFRFEPSRQEIVGERSNRRFRLADAVSVRLARVDQDSRRIDFVLG
jgi:ribonuclease R